MTANHPTTPPFDWDDELPPETAADVYGALLRALRRKQGFGLFFVQCTPDQGEKIVADLRRDLPQQRIEFLHLPGEVLTLYDQIDQLWQQQPFEVLVVEGLQASLYAYEDTKRFSGWSSEDIYQYSWKGVPQILNHLNQRREQLRNDFPARLVFLVPPFVVDYFIQRAADFLDWRSGLFRFPPDPNQIAQDTERLATEGYADYQTLAPQARIAKVLELKSLLNFCPDAEGQVSILFQLGLLFAAEQDYENAIVSWEKALNLKPDHVDAWYNRGVVLSNLGLNEEAIAAYDQALQLKPNKHEAWAAQGLALSNLGRKQAAIAAYDQALKFKPDDHQVWYNRGNALYNLGRKEEAIAAYDQALKFKPNYANAWNNRGIALSDLGRKEEAIAAYDQALKFKPNYADAWYARGNALYNLGRNEEAIAAYDQALKFKPDHVNAWNNRGYALSDLGLNEEAIAAYDQALKFKPDHINAWNNRGNALSALGRKEEAITAYDQALKFKPDDHAAWTAQGLALSNLGRKQKAIAAYDQALKFKPDYANAWYNKACCYALQGDVELAIVSLQQAIHLNPDRYCELATTDTDIDGIRADDRFQALLGGHDAMMPERNS